ncbi:hypothetical protein [Eoetvoesiella caeni]|uniref:Uncharacterized protein n=1 Tax=Eoetvoesiella caeni TaxID=645616 RepID=A0A366GZF7_9BURK|nr:hypothetical protein [Eoetvoesiella caeni]MCI2811234.1 hypothetical protein [Eoetvoesiella caeni]NYT57116.1 hypothetical protein [Eoetvoesiella caeni]RBP34105.1 hypothetical protein DFR37_1248 [Eoetvoesiella caeni]
MTEKSRSDDCHAAINLALKNYLGEAYVEPARKTIKSGDYRKIGRLQIDQGVIALVQACKLSGGSVADMDLYKLVRIYLWDKDARAAMNRIVEAKDLI